MGERRVAYEPLAQVQRAPRNPRRHDEAGIRSSLSGFGVVDLPVIDERTGRLVSGHGRLDQLSELHAKGAEPPDGVQVDPQGRWLVPVVRGWSSRTDAEAEAYLVAANKISENGGWDSSLDELLADLASEDWELAALTGFTAAELEELIAATEVDLDQPGLVHEAVPATGAAWAETPEQEAARRAAVATQIRSAVGLTEMILVYTEDDRAEVSRTISAVRAVLGADLKASEVVLRALRTLIAVLDERHRAEPIRMSVFARVAGATDLDPA